MYPAIVTGIDFSHLEDYMTAIYVVGLRDGTVMIKDILRIPKSAGKGKIWGMRDMIDMRHFKQKRNKRNRHYKAKAQPNCGPRGNNPW
jgi:hypothetical protein